MNYSNSQRDGVILYFTALLFGAYALSELTEKCRPYLEALKAAPRAVKEFIDGILERFKKQEKIIYYEPIPAPKTQSQERGKRSKNKDYER